MHNNAMKDWVNSSYLASSNRIYIEKLYDHFLMDPDSVNQDWRLKFKYLSDTDFKLKEVSHTLNDCSFLNQNSASNYTERKILKMIDDFRVYGHQHAKLDPLGLWKRKNIKNLHLKNYKFVDSDFQKTFNIDCFSVSYKNIKLIDLYNFLKQVYCGSIGLEYMHVTNSKEIYWIQQQVETLNNIGFETVDKKRLLYELIAAESIERYLGMKFPAAKRFSLEGSDVLIPMLKEIIRQAAINYGIKEIMMGMAHRGRLNVLTNVFGKSLQQLFDEFANKNIYESYGSGDVKYHMGLASDIKIGDNLIHVSLMYNPSHLEIINPVVMGSVRARIDEEIKCSNMILPITLHGDASISGQGVVQETFNMSKTRGYDVGGSIRIVVNNQIGFTTSNIRDIRSTEYCTDIAKMINAPILHVNADDPEAVIFVTSLALRFRNLFKRDIIIDLVSYRRQGHNEADEPRATQPIMYKKINQHPSVCQIYSSQLEYNDIIKASDIEEMFDELKNKLDLGACLVQECQNVYDNFLVLQDKKTNKFTYANYPEKTDTNYLQELACKISSIPSDIDMHPRVAKIYSDRYEMAQGKKNFDWGAAETLAYATLLDKGISIRLSGEDSSRGTFFHRHSVIHTQKDDSLYIPLQNISENQGIYYIWDSVLSEEAALAFEYGYANHSKNTLVIWEAQFGDFSNGAQIVIDQFISSGEQKWGQVCNLVMLLPHGYEGQGPEHSSARLERYLQLCAENNIQVCVPSTAAQLYHLLRKQIICNVWKPLIIMSPKSLLRNPIASSSIKEIACSAFQTIVKELDSSIINHDVIQIIICTGKIYYDLLNKRCKNKQYNVAIIRIEQLYPFPLKELKNILLHFSRAKRIVWCQEEPENQGAWHYCQYYLHKIISTSKNILLNYIGRPASAATAVGFAYIHQRQQKEIIDDALNIDKL